jgi:hypothetical protein
MERSVRERLRGSDIQGIGRGARDHAVFPDYIEKIALACSLATEEIFRILYYDCAPYEGTAILPVSGQPKKFLLVVSFEARE